MVLIRPFEERTGEMYTRAKIGGYCHLNLGEEATIVGLMAALEPRDYIFTNYREHGYVARARRRPERGDGRAVRQGDRRLAGPRRLDAPVRRREARFMGGYAIVGGQLPLATGAALAIALPGHWTSVVVCQMGDATTNIGALHESLNLAALWKLPVVFVIVNNRYGMGTTVETGSAEPELYKKALRLPHARRAGGRQRRAGRARRRARGRRARPQASSSRPCWRRSASACAATRWSTRTATASREEVERAAPQDPVPAFARAAHRGRRRSTRHG